MTVIFSNPELLRNLRAQLRMTRVLTAFIICNVLGVAFTLLIRREQSSDWGLELLRAALSAQASVLLLWGGISCLHAILREKESNTFDFQRLTRLHPLELAVGKLLGPAALPYCIFLFLMPYAVLGAWVGGTRPSFLLASWVIILVGSATFHSLALVTSLLLPRGGTVAATLLYLALVGITSAEEQPYVATFAIARPNPFFAVSLAEQTSWDIPSYPEWAETHLSDEGWRRAGYPTWTVDVFFGNTFHHFWVLIVLYSTMLAWSLLVLARNIKRDPALHQLFTPPQSLCFALYINCLLLGFFMWRHFSVWDQQSFLTWTNASLFLALALDLMNTRELARLQIAESGNGHRAWLATWPAPYLLAGLVSMGLLIVLVIERSNPLVRLGSWDRMLALFNMGFFTFWVVRDVMFLQWMRMRRGRHSFGMGMLYLAVYYICFALLAIADRNTETSRLPLAALIDPTKFLWIDANSWSKYRALWMLALFAQLVIAGFFAFLQHRKLRELSAGIVDTETQHAPSS